MKKCTKCQVEKDESEFFIRNKKTGRLHCQCKSCKRIIDKDYYKLEGSSRAVNMRRNAVAQILKVKQYVRSYKENNCCSKCGDKRWYVLDFHHLRDKQETISIMIKRGVSILTVQKEMDKCILLCANCHREEHYQNMDL